jgi:hypothetical protein
MHTCIDAQDRLDMAGVCHLLQERGYDVIYRFEHVHATRDQREFHICLVTDLASMSRQGFLSVLEDALKPRVEEGIALKHRSGK